MEGEGNSYTRLDTHTQELNNKHADRKGGKTYVQGYAYNKITVPDICIEFAGKEEREKKRSYEYKTKHKPRSALNTIKKTGREESIHIRHRLIETGKQTRNGLGRDQGYYW